MLQGSLLHKVQKQWMYHPFFSSVYRASTGKPCIRSRSVGCHRQLPIILSQTLLFHSNVMRNDSFYTTLVMHQIKASDGQKTWCVLNIKEPCLDEIFLYATFTMSYNKDASVLSNVDLEPFLKYSTTIALLEQ